MPIINGVDSNGHYYRFGMSTKFYYKFNDLRSRRDAYKKCLKQVGAIFSYK